MRMEKTVTPVTQKLIKPHESDPTIKTSKSKPMKQRLSLKAAFLTAGLLLLPGALHADVLIPLSNTWGEYDYNRYLYGIGNGNLTLSAQTASGFTARVTSNYVDVVNNGSGAIGADGQAEGPQGRPAVFQEFPDIDISHPGQKLTLSFDIQFHNVMKVTDKRFRFGLGSTNSNATVYLMVDTGVASGGSAQFRPDPFMTDVTGITLWDLASTPQYPWTYTANGYANSPTLTNLNNPLDPLGPNKGYVSGILSHFASSGGNSQASVNDAPNGNINGLGADPTTLGVVHHFTYSFQRTNDGSGATSINAGNGLTLAFSWGNSAGPEVKSSATPLYNDHADIPANGGPLDSDRNGCLQFHGQRHLYEWKHRGELHDLEPEDRLRVPQGCRRESQSRCRNGDADLDLHSKRRAECQLPDRIGRHHHRSCGLDTRGKQHCIPRRFYHEYDSRDGDSESAEVLSGAKTLSQRRPR